MKARAQDKEMSPSLSKSIGTKAQPVRVMERMFWPPATRSRVFRFRFRCRFRFGSVHNLGIGRWGVGGPSRGVVEASRPLSATSSRARRAAVWHPPG